ncbi:MAG: rhodanese-like domain-containing protein [Candidatus Eisenbacteria bacterium]
MSPNRDRPTRGDPPRGGPLRTPVLFVLACLVLSLALPPSSVNCQWPPWLAKDAPEPVYPEILIDAPLFEETAFREDDPRPLVVDAREAGAYRAGHLRGAVSLPADSIDFGPGLLPFLHRHGFPVGRPLFLYGGSDPREAATVWWGLVIGGQGLPLLLDGGLPAWLREFGESRLQKIGSAAEQPRGGSSASFDTTTVANAPWVREHFGTEGVEILDVRDSTAWEAGHVPHALPFDPRIVTGSDGTFMEGEEIRAILARLGPRPSTTVDLGAEFVVYDEGTGREAALAALVLRLGGIEKVRVFPGGWGEWSADSTAPVVRIATADEVDDRVGGTDEENRRRNVLLVDVRNRRDHEIRYIPGSVCIRSDQFVDSLGAVVERACPGVDPGALTLVLYCYGPDCIRSRQCATWAARQGFRDLWWFLGGLPEWWGAGKETRTAR